MPFSSMSCRSVLCRAVPCRSVSCHAMSFLAVPCHTVPCHTIPCHVVPCRAVSFRAVPCRRALDRNAARRPDRWRSPGNAERTAAAPTRGDLFPFVGPRQDRWRLQPQGHPMVSLAPAAVRRPPARHRRYQKFRAGRKAGRQSTGLGKTLIGD